MFALEELDAATVDSLRLVLRVAMLFKALVRWVRKCDTLQLKCWSNGPSSKQDSRFVWSKVETYMIGDVQAMLGLQSGLLFIMG